MLRQCCRKCPGSRPSTRRESPGLSAGTGFGGRRRNQWADRGSGAGRPTGGRRRTLTIHGEDRQFVSPDLGSWYSWTRYLARNVCTVDITYSHDLLASINISIGTQVHQICLHYSSWFDSKNRFALLEESLGYSGDQYWLDLW